MLYIIELRIWKVWKAQVQILWKVGDRKNSHLLRSILNCTIKCCFLLSQIFLICFRVDCVIDASHCVRHVNAEESDAACCAGNAGSANPKDCELMFFHDFRIYFTSFNFNVFFMSFDIFMRFNIFHLTFNNMLLLTHPFSCFLIRTLLIST